MTLYVESNFVLEIALGQEELAPAERLWRLHFMGGTMAHVLSWSHVLPEMTGGLCDPSDRKALTARLVSFLSAGFRAPSTEAH